MTTLQRNRFVGLLAVAITLTGCGGGTRPRHIALIGDTVSSGWPNAPGLPALLGRTLDLPVQDLTAIRRPPNYSVQQALQVEVPAVAADTTDAVVALGAYDLEAQANGWLSTISVQDANLAVVQALMARNIHVYELTVRDYSRDRRWKRGAMPLWRARKIRLLANQYNSFVLATPGITVIDIRKYPALLNTPSYYASDGLHLSEAGQRAYAEVVASVVSGKPLTGALNAHTGAMAFVPRVGQR